MYAVIETAGKQYRVELGTELEIDRMDVQPGQTIQLERVLLIADGDTTEIGRPTVAGATVALDVLRQARGEKIIVFKYRPKARHRAKKGHRQDLTVLRVSDIAWGDRSAAADARDRDAADQRAADAARRDADRRAAADRALADKLGREAAPAETSSAETAVTGEGAASPASRGTSGAAPKKARSTPAKPASAPTPGSKAAGRSAGRAPSSRTQAPTPGKAAPKRPTTKKDG